MYILVHLGLHPLDPPEINLERHQLQSEKARGKFEVAEIRFFFGWAGWRLKGFNQFSCSFLTSSGGRGITS